MVETIRRDGQSFCDRHHKNALWRGLVQVLDQRGGERDRGDEAQDRRQNDGAEQPHLVALEPAGHVRTLKRSTMGRFCGRPGYGLSQIGG